MALIDVILPVRNGIDFLAESLDSIRGQTLSDWRLLVLDHGSSDGSRELVQSYQERDPRIELHEFPQADGLSELLNLGLDLCNGRYVMRHDADDIAFPDRMEASLAAFDNTQGVAAIGGMATMIDGRGKVTGELRNAIGRDRLTAASLFCNPVIHPTVMFNLYEVHRLGIRYGVDFIQALPAEHRMQVSGLAEDYFLFGQLSITGKMLNIPNKLIKYRWHGNNVSVLKFLDQMDISIDISRNLARSFSAMHGEDFIDPAPFCNHGGIMFDVEGEMDFSPAFDKLASSLRNSLGEHNLEVERELSYRRVLATRHPAKLISRYLQFKYRYMPDTCEWYAVKSWFTRHLPNKHKIVVKADRQDLIAV